MSELRTLLLLLVGFAVGACGHVGARLHDFEVRDANGPVFESIFSTDDRLTTAETWVHLGRPPFAVKEETLRVVVDPGDPLRGRLDGTLTFELRHVKRVMATGTVEGLQLSRESAQDDRWYLTRAEVERTAHAAGLTLPAD